MVDWVGFNSENETAGLMKDANEYRRLNRGLLLLVALPKCVGIGLKHLNQG
jgi:hypothetical protein